MSVVSDLPLLNNMAMVLRATIVSFSFFCKGSLCVCLQAILYDHLHLFVYFFACNNVNMSCNFKNLGASAKITAEHTHRRYHSIENNNKM